MNLGINDGGYFQHSIKYPYKQEDFDNVSKLGCNCVEIRLEGGTLERLPFLDLERFDWKSFHILNISKLDDYEYEQYLETLQDAVKEFGFSNVVFHRNYLKNINDIKRFADIPWSIENMSEDLSFDRHPLDMKDLFERFPSLKMTLDIQHALTVDHSGKILEDFWRMYENLISEFHLSDGSYHVPSYVFRNKVIENFLKGKNVPIILESVYSNYGEHVREVSYIKSL